MRNMWDMNDIDNSLSDIKGRDVIEAIRANGNLGMNRWVLVTDSCAMLFADLSLQKKFPETASFLRQVYNHMIETGYLVPKE